jgi:type II secretory pathway pseudopilin PulG
MIRNNRRRGFSILCMLMALAIIGVLTSSYMGTDVPGGKPWAVTQQDRARSAVTAINTRTAQTQYFMATEGRRPDIERLRIMMNNMSQTSGMGGRYFIDHREELRNTLQLQTPTFRETVNLPRTR